MRCSTAGIFALVALPLAAEPGGTAPPAVPAEALQDLAREVRRDLGPGHTIEPLEDLFVVATNADRPTLDRCRATVSRAYRSLCRTFFDARPDTPLAVYLFRDRVSYEDYCLRRWREKPSTPYGFFRPDEHKLVMNIATGTGTLVHELVHPLLAADFPEVPAWFNEGLASLYEQCRFDEAAGALRGMVNWRLPNLQQALGDGRYVPLKDLFAGTADAFYGDATGLTYAEARYLCLYLQEQGHLVAFYKTFRAAASEPDTGRRDLTGRLTLQAVTGRTLEAFEREWKAWVGGLRWEGGEIPNPKSQIPK
jgi:hypothetical protein